MLLTWLTLYPAEITIGLGFLLLALAWWMIRPKSTETRFKLREADRLAQQPRSGSSTDFAQEKIKRPVQLTGIRIDGPPHEILGVPLQAGETEIQKAYKDLMKRYHPDSVGRPDSPEWQEAQKIAEAINSARTTLIDRIKKK